MRVILTSVSISFPHTWQAQLVSFLARGACSSTHTLLAMLNLLRSRAIRDKGLDAELPALRWYGDSGVIGRMSPRSHMLHPRASRAPRYSTK